MPMSYHMTGMVCSILSMLAAAGLATQSYQVLQRSWFGFAEGTSPTSVLSINRFTTSFVVFFAMYLYGGLLDPFNHYLVWPRVIAILFVLAILIQIYRDRRCCTSGLALLGCLSLFVFSVITLPFVRPIENLSPAVVPVLIVAIGLTYLQGGAVQIMAIRRARGTGGLSREMHRLFVCKDVSLAAFALSMPWQAGWPILFTSIVGLTVNLSTLACFSYFRDADERHHGGRVVRPAR